MRAYCEIVEQPDDGCWDAQNKATQWASEVQTSQTVLIDFIRKKFYKILKYTVIILYNNLIIQFDTNNTLEAIDIDKVKKN